MYGKCFDGEKNQRLSTTTGQQPPFYDMHDFYQSPQKRVPYLLVNLCYTLSAKT